MSAQSMAEATMAEATATSVAKPAIARGASALERRPNFLSEVVIDFGPRDMLSRLFLKADTELRQLGIELSFADLDELVVVNRQNLDSWRPLLPIFDPQIGGVTPDTGFAMLGRNSRGEVVTAQAARLYTFPDTNLKKEMESLRLFYADPGQSALAGESLRVNAPSAANIDGRIAFVGAVWYRPDYRGNDLVNILARAVRACAFTRWYTDITFSIMADGLVKRGLASRAGYPHVEWGVEMRNTPVLRNGIIQAALVWTTAAEQLEFFSSYLTSRAQVDPMVDDRAADQERVA